MKRPLPPNRRPPEIAARMCTGKRRYPGEGAALEAAALVGVERHRQAYQCPLCGHWHLTSR